MGAKRDRAPPNTFMERLFKPSVVWQGENGEGNADLITPPTAKHNAHKIGSPDIEITPSAHEIMAVIAPWTKPFLAYLNRQELPNDQSEAQCIVQRSKAFKVHEGELYKRSTTGVLQRCISDEEG